MALDLGANFKITAGVAGQAAVDRLNQGVSQLDAGLSKLPGVAKVAGLALVGLGAGLSVGVFKEKFDGVVENILRVKDAAEKTGSSIGSIGGLAQVAKITGDDFGQIEAGIIKMNKALAGSDDTAKGAAHALSAIGLNIADLREQDPAEAFRTIAKTLAQFEDSGAKSAIAMDIFGKSGAALLPFMKDYVEVGDQVSKVTAEQAEQAENYDRNLRRLQAAKQELYKVVATQVLPVADAFVQMLLRSANETDGVKASAKALAADGSMQSFFREAGRAGAALLDVLALIKNAVLQVADSFGVVWNDIKTGAEVAALAIGSGFTQEGRDAIRKALAERDAYLEAANKRMVERFSDLTPYSRKLEEIFDKQDAGGGRDEPKPPPRSLKGYVSREPTVPKAKAEPDPYGTEFNALGKEAEKLKFQITNIALYDEKLTSAREATVRFDIEQKKFGDLSKDRADALLNQARAVDALAEQLRQAKVAQQVSNQTKAYEAETEAIGLNRRERELLVFAQSLENQGIKEGTERYRELTEARRAAIERRDAVNADPTTGIKSAISEIQDRAGTTADAVKNSLVSAFDRAGDALGEFVTTGKLNFKSFAASILADLAKMIAKQLLFNALKTGLSAIGGAFGGGAAAGASTATAGTASIATFAANGAAFSAGAQAFATGGVVNSPTAFRFANGGTMRNGVMGEAGPEAIIPLKRGKDGKLGVTVQGAVGGGGVSIGSIVIQNGQAESSNEQGPNSVSLGKQIASAVQAVIIKEQRPGGLLSPV